MIKQDDLILGLSFYQKHEYLPALKHFSKAARHQHNEISKMIYQSLEAVTNMQLCKYNAAAQQLKELKSRLHNWEINSSQSQRTPQIQLLKIKVLANLLIVYLVNCKETQLENTLIELDASIRDKYTQNKVVGASLFKALLKSLFGFQSFSQIQGELFSALSKFDRSESPRFKQLRNANTLRSPIILSSLSIYCHLTGNISDAIKLQKIAYSMTRQENPVAAIISLRHLQQLEKEAGNDKQKRIYHEQLAVMMNNEEFQGIPDQTLFRNYSEKIKLANKIIKRLSQLEKRLIVKQNDQQFSKKAVIRKLKSMQDQRNQEKIDVVIGLIKKDSSILNVMAQAEFINEANDEYQSLIDQFLSIITKFQFNRKRNLMRECLQTIKSFQKKKKVIINKIVKQQPQSQSDNEISEEVSINQKQISYSRVKKDKQGELPPKIISTFRSETQRRPQKHSPSPINSSRIESKPITNSKMIDRKHIYLNQAQQQKPKYKIGKDDSKKASKIQKGRQTKQKIKTEVSQKQQQPIQKNPIGQFMREVIPAKSKVSEAPIHLPIKQQKIKKDEIIQESEAVKIPLIRNNQIQSRIPKPPPMNPSYQQNSSSQVKKSNQLYTGSGKSMIPKYVIKDNYNQRLQAKIRKCINLCIAGQYIEKRHFSSDGGAQRFLKLGTHKDKLFWGQDEDHFDQSSYNVQDIKGIVMGKVTQTMLKESNRKLQPWKCFSLIFKKRTFDVFCPQQKDLKFWIPGLSLFLKDLKLDNKKYMVKSAATKKIERPSHKSIVIGQNVITRYYSTGRVLWKKFLMRMQWDFLATKKKEKRNIYSNANAYAIVVGAVRLMSYVPTKIKRNVQ